MIIRALTTLRARLLAAAILLSISSTHSPVCLAANPYERTDDAEGDPGDGVLDPKFTSSGGPWGDPVVSEFGAGGGVADTWDDGGLVPVMLPDGRGHVTVLLLVHAWWRPLAEFPDHHGRWHDAP